MNKKDLIETAWKARNAAAITAVVLTVLIDELGKSRERPVAE